jgi:hypothetical protein
VSLREAFSFTARSLTSALQGDLRSPSWRGADTDLSVRAARRRLDVASIVLGSCPSSQRWNGAVCEERCAASATWNGSACVARNVACPRGMSWDGARCKPSVQCPSGTVFNAGECVAERVECPAGSTWTGQECRAQERKVTITTSAPSAVASTPTPVTASIGTPWRMLGTGAGVVGAVAALGGGAWFLQANSVIDNPDSSGVQKDTAVTGQSGGLALFAGGVVVGVAGAAAALWPTASTTEETR